MQFSNRSWYALFILLSLSVGCAPQPAFTPTPTKTPDAGLAQVTEQTATFVPTEIATTAAPTIETPQIAPTVETPTPTLDPALPTPTPTDTPPPPTPDDGLPADHYVMDRPFANIYADYGDRTYSYGLTSGGAYRPHTGLDYRNMEGTPVLAAANSIVEFAGTDEADQFGPQLNFYGNLIVLRLTDYTYNGQSVYALYGHLSAISVQTGQTVATKQEIGLVGGTGVAAGGAHLHFEVRVGDPRSYATSTRNPDLWIKPYYGYGTIAGKITDEAGNYLSEVSITIRGANRVLYTYTYAGPMNIPDAAWGENWTYGDLEEGWYTVTFKTNRTHTYDVYVRAGRTSWVEAAP